MSRAPGTPAADAEPPNPRKASLLGSSAIMAAGTVVSRVTGFGRAAIIAAALGLTLTADVFNVPNVIPNMLYILVGGGILNSVLVPVLVRAIKNDADGGEAYSQRLFSLAVTVLAAATAIAVLAAPLILRAIVDSRYLEPDMRPFFDNMVTFARFCLPQIFFYGLYVLIGQILNAKGRFGPMMWSPILNNVVAIAVFGVYLVVFGTKSPETFSSSETLLLGLGSTAGVAAQALVLLPVLRQTGFSLRFRTDWKGQGLAEPVKLGMWTFGFVIVNQVAYVFFVNVATSASAAGDDGAGYTVYANAMLIMMVPHSVITVSLATALLPRLSDLAADGYLDQVRDRLVSAIRACLAIIIPLGALTAVLAYPLTAMIFDYGSARGQTDMLARTLIALMPGLLAFTVHYLSLRGFYALQDTKTPFFTQVWIAAIMVVWALGITFVSPSPDVVTMTLAAGYSAAYVAGATVSVIRLQQRIGRIALAPLVQHVVRILIPTAIGSTVAWLVWQGWSQLGLLDPLPSMLTHLGDLIVAGTIGSLVIVALAYAMRIAEVRRAVAMVLARLRGGTARMEADTAPEPVDEQALEETAEHPSPIVETGTLSIFRQPAFDPDVTVEFFLDETMHGATMHGVPSVTSTMTGHMRRPVDPNAGIKRAQRADHLSVDTQPELPLRPVTGNAAQTSGRAQLLAGRYRVERLLDDSAGVRSWHGFDDVLQRPVFIQTLDDGDPRAEQFVVAARRASTIEDPRFLRVLDIGSDGVSYMVREWTPGRDLSTLLGDGPFHTQHASAIGREVADALATAHAQRLFHRHLVPSLVFLTAEGSIKIAGLETEAVLHGPAEVYLDGAGSPVTDPVALDAAGVGGVLYACLTAHWPTNVPDSGLHPAPRMDGKLPSARQIRPGIPTALDVITDRAVGNARRHHTVPLSSPLQIAAELGAGPRTDEFVVPAQHPAPSAAPNGARADEVNGSYLATMSGAGVPPGTSRRDRRRTSRLNRFLGVIGAALLLVGATLLGLQLMLSAFDSDDDSPSDRVLPTEDATTDPSTGSPEPDEEIEPTPLELAAADYFDPFGSTPESPTAVGDAIDGDTGTAWPTLTYYSPLEDQKEGVGLYVDIGDEQGITEIQLMVLNAGADVEFRVAEEGASAPPDNIDDWELIHRAEDVGDELTHTLDEAVTSRYLLVWFTRLPPYEGNYRSGVTEVTVLGTEGGS
ncbi:murein biosynthesis integral membrane protein MurJ [Phytoactinopolyspora halotolerans]|uniref:Murein biosynthesis integral membrane protein MurJ n=1 Tax=Phytoactinopolyspora halotolerans TaxID=1981512 RepID=A0A6L9S0Y7_9ACTN|nr:murein biosynthesis integral membrane protein MurJ [Phytoactinopolyspora halotolerans]NED98686.1 murein biosynthesis integral membrane protein MurJ [Phytoactinopolyspora halotolerans]